jgi:hypothetical protein
LLDNKLISKEDQVTYQQILSKQSSISDLKRSIKDLSQYIYEVVGIAPYLLIDEYDSAPRAA